MKVLITALSVIFVLTSAQAAYAQRLLDTPIVQHKSYLTTPYYNQMVREALSKRPERFNFMKFRSLYSRTRQYDPIGDKVLKTINDLAYIILNETDPERAETARFAYQIEVSNHLAHIDVVMLALSFAREDQRFGQVQFFEWMRDGLIRTVTISGDGYTLAGAYDVITLSEETILMNRLGVQTLDSKPVQEGIIYYNMHDVIDLKTQKQRTVFVNTSIPMKHLAELEQQRRETLSIDIRKPQ